MASPIAPPTPISVDLTLGETRLSLQAQLPGGPLRPARLLPLLRTVSDAIVQQTAARVSAGGDVISCKAGCDACCHYLVPISRVEARRLSDVVARMPAPQRQQVLQRLAAARERLEAAGLLARLQAPESVASAEDHDALAEAYFAQRLPCAFLEAGRCTIYAERPFTCREFLVVSPALRCGAPSAEPVELVTLPGRVAVAAGALEGPPFLQGGWVPLVLALAWTEGNPEPPPAESGAALAERFFSVLADSG